jgi:uncharacterized protein YpmB
MKQVKIRYIVIIAGLLISCILVTSCKTAAREEKYYEKQENKLAGDQQKAYDKKLKDFKRMQSDETRKMMKTTDKQAKKFNNKQRRR